MWVLFIYFLFPCALFSIPFFIPNGVYLKRHIVFMSFFLLFLSWHGSPLHPSSKNDGVCLLIMIFAVIHFFSAFIRVLAMPWSQGFKGHNAKSRDAM